MAQKSSYTLFRFAQLSNPQQVSEENRKKFFVYHPDGETSPFFDAIKGIDDPVKKSKNLEKTAQDFSDFENLDDVKTFKPDLYEFAVWIARNSSTLNDAEVQDKIQGLSPLTKWEQEKVWNNLFDECLTQENPYLRDACMELLVASHFINLYQDIDKDDETLQDLASSTVVLPKVMFEIKKELPTNEEVNSQLSGYINKQAFKEQMQNAENKLKADILLQASQELELAETTYHKTNATTYQSAYKKWQGELSKQTPISHEAIKVDAQIMSLDVRQTAQLKTTQSAQQTNQSQEAENEPTVEVATGEVGTTTYKKMDYTPVPQIKLSELKKVLSPESVQALTEAKLDNKGTFVEVQQGLTELSKVESKKIFEVTNFYTATVDMMGIPLLSDAYSTGVNYSFYLKAYKKASKNYALHLIVNTANLGNEVSNIDYEAKIPPVQNFNSYKTSFTNGLLIIELTPNFGLQIADNKQKLEIKGSIEFTNGAKLLWDEKMDMKEGVFGIMTFEESATKKQELFIPNGFGITRLGIAEYRKVEQHLCCYVAGEVSHIENVMAREYKERSTRRLRKSDITTTETEESESETLTDTSTTSRFDMQKEVSEVVSEQTQFGMHASIGVNTHYVKVDVGANYSQNKSKEKSKNEAVNMSKDITQKATDRLTSKVKKERVKKIVEEFEEQNRHGFDNREGAEHISGVFRWVDKIYKNEIYNYGKRLTYEFQIPEPARLHHLAKQSSVKQGKVSIEMPKNPKTGTFGTIGNLNNPNNLTEANYMLWAAQYGADGVQSPPSRILVVGDSLLPTKGESSVQKNIPIPSGYGLKRAVVSVKSVNYRTYTFNVAVAIAGISEYLGESIDNHLLIDESKLSEIEYYENTIPFSASFFNTFSGSVNASLILKRKQEHFEQWQLETYNSIMDAYNDKMKDYQDALAQAEAKQGILMGTNPAFYQEIIHTVLKKNCIDYLIGANNLGQNFIIGNDSMQNVRVKNTQEMDRYSAMVKFIEQAFEWDIMSYMFYPFYWADKQRWETLYNYDVNDKRFKEFMQAGMGRVIVTVRPNFEKSVQWYLKTGQIWNGLDTPIFDEDLFLSITDELNNPEYKIEETWETREPSTLTLIQSDTIALKAEGLPCFCDEEVQPKEIIGKSEVLKNLNVGLKGNGE
ncbi:MAG: hypothetical protein HWD85_12100 [Flavobacteriaceae bacterium]|nr:hypothetical protein [Flavobacteriaceae bacterium]